MNPSPRRTPLSLSTCSGEGLSTDICHYMYSSIRIWLRFYYVRCVRSSGRSSVVYSHVVYECT